MTCVGMRWQHDNKSEVKTYSIEAAVRRRHGLGCCLHVEGPLALHPGCAQLFPARITAAFTDVLLSSLPSRAVQSNLHASLRHIRSHAENMATAGVAAHQ